MKNKKKKKNSSWTGFWLCNLSFIFFSNYIQLKNYSILVCWVTEFHCNGNTDRRNSWKQHLGFLQAGITCVKEQQERRSLGLLFNPACCSYRQLCHLGLYILKNSWEPGELQCTLTCSFIIDWNVTRTGSCQRKAALTSFPTTRQQTALWKHPDKMGCFCQPGSPCTTWNFRDLQHFA